MAEITETIGVSSTAWTPGCISSQHLLKTVAHYVTVKWCCCSCSLI